MGHPENPHKAEVLALCDRGLTYGQIANRLGISRSAVAGIVFRASSGLYATRLRDNRSDNLIRSIRRFAAKDAALAARVLRKALSEIEAR